MQLDDAHRPRAVILGVRPEVDGGRYPVKRVAGEPLALEADIVGDGHDVLRAVVVDAAQRETELVLGADDTWRATLVLEALGHHHLHVLAWVDAWATWRRGLARKRAANVPVELELLEGALLIELVDRAAAARLRAGDVAVIESDALAVAMQAAPRGPVARAELAVMVERPRAACASWYELFPRSTRADGKHGSLRDAEGRLDYIAELGFDIVYLPPIHPIGRAFRKGPDNAPVAGPGDPGSPWAIGGPEGGHTSVHPELGTLADFDRFVAAARTRGLEVALDIAFQASPDHPWVQEHPSWFRARPDGSIQYAENPPKKYQDVYPFDFEGTDWQALWTALRDVFAFWCERGVRAFRVDNPHTKPIRFWQWCLREIQDRYPDAIFLAEAFTRPKLMGALAKAGFSQSYTYFAWRTTKHELETYLRELAAQVEFYRPCFWPTTPDIFPEHLVHGGRPAFALRAVLAGTLAASYGIYGPSYELCEAVPRVGPKVEGGGPAPPPVIEELARSEKYEVRTWDVERADSLRHLLARLNQIRRAHPALQQDRALAFHGTDNELVLCYSKRAGEDVVLVVVNLDPHHAQRAWLRLDLAALGVGPDESFQVHDLLGEARYTWRGPHNFVELVPDQAPAHVFELRHFLRSEHHFEYFL